MRINISGDTLHITFSYAPSCVRAIREVPGRVFNPAQKRWEVPGANVRECLAALLPIGFVAHQDVKIYAARFEKQLADAEEMKINPPEPYAGELPLYDFQKIGASFLRAMPASLLADAPGLGKTIQVIAALEPATGPFLVLCPASLKYSWKEEIQKWKPDEEVVVVDGDKKTRCEQWKTHARWYIANYELLIHDWEEMPKTWAAIVGDEATRFSNPETITAKNLKQLSAHKKIALTGTPISNSPADLFSIIDWLSPRYLGNQWQFRRRYCIVDERWPSRILGFQNLTELKEKVSHFILRRTKEEVFTDFPPKTVQDIVFNLSDEERKLYESVQQMILEDWRLLTIETQSLSVMMVKMLRLKQATCHPRLISEITQSSKFELLKETIETIVNAGEKVLVFTQFKEMAKIIFNSWIREDVGILAIHGETPNDKRQQVVRLFNEEPFYKVLVMTEAGAYGLNLQAASYVIHYDFPWSVAKLMQREDRAHRIGNDKPVTVYNLIARNTIDEYVAKKLLKKQKLAVELLQDIERLELQGIEEEDIKAILRI